MWLIDRQAKSNANDPRSGALILISLDVVIDRQGKTNPNDPRSGALTPISLDVVIDTQAKSNVSGRESGLNIRPRKPFQPTYHCLVGELTPEYRKGLILGSPHVGKGARNPLLGIYSIKEIKESNKDPGENVSWIERIRERIRTIYMATKAIPNYQPLPRGGVDLRVT